MLKRISGIVTVLLCASLCLTSGSVLAGESKIAVGDHWAYLLGADMDDFTISGTVEYEITSEYEQNIGGTPTSVLACKMTGDGTVSYSYSGQTYTGNFEMSGTQVAVESSFNMVSMNEVMTMGITVQSVTMNIGIGLSLAAVPPVDTYVGNDNLSVGATMNSSSTLTISGWMDMGLGNNVTMPASDDDVDVAMEVVAEGVSITVPAGTFSCWKIEITEDGEDPYYAYYSEEVGYYVKVDGADSSLYMGDMQLTSYSYSGAGADSTIMMVIIAGAVIAIVIIAAVAFMLMKRKGRGPTPLRPEQQVPPPMPPQTPPPGPPMQPGQSP